jgi:formylglycine-generating enzyme required for sulfatase activity
MPCPATPPPDAPDALRVEDRWLTETVLALARGVAADRALDRLPILADALEDAGCDNLTLLNHLRADEQHAVGCWALRQLLRTTLMLPGGVPIAFTYCPPGSFLMGSDHPDAHGSERPTHRVTLTRGFYAAIYPVYQQLWWAVMGDTPSDMSGRFLPVRNVTWEEAAYFCQRVSVVVGVSVRLPTEAEWEYACRAGTNTEYHFGDEPDTGMMNHAAEFSHTYGVGREPSLVGTFPPNDWGLFDTHGNVWEWCQDWYDERYYARSPPTDPECRDGAQQYRVLRGGSFCNSPGCCRAAFRLHGRPGMGDRDYGFRVVFTA